VAVYDLAQQAQADLTSLSLPCPASSRAWTAPTPSGVKFDAMNPATTQKHASVQ
jgi:hypothetical protein